MFVWTEQTWEKCGVAETDGVLAALSGGADSVALLLGLHTLHRNGRIARLCAAHLHHGIRGEDADADEAFSRALCEALQIPFHAEHVDVPAIAATEGISLELAARNARYAFLRKTRESLGLDVIALGHHRDDQAETLLLHLLRGSGTDGLAGMRVRSGDLIRPLLYTDRAEILRFLEERGQSYRTDGTNFLTDATRNKLRLSVIPALETVNPAAKRALAKTAQWIAEDADYLNGLADRAANECGTDRKKLSALDRPIRMRVLKRLLPYADYTSDDLNRLDALLNGQTGDEATLKNGVVAWLDATDLRIGVPPAERYCVPLPDTGTVRLPHGVLRIERTARADVPCAANEAYIDADRLNGAVHARSPEAGDRFTPFGMRGTKLLSDCYTDRRIPRFFRRGPVVCDETGIVFVAGLTTDERMRVTAQTVHILHYQYEED